MAMGINLCVSLDLQAVEIEFDAKIWLLILNMATLRLWRQPGFFFFVLIGKLWNILRTHYYSGEKWKIHSIIKA